MSKRYSAAIERAVQIELLRAQAGLQRQTVSMHSQRLVASLDPTRQIESLLGGSEKNLLRQGASLVSQYPFLLSLASNALTSRRGRGLLGIGAGVAGAWWLVSKLLTSNPRR